MKETITAVVVSRASGMYLTWQMDNLNIDIIVEVFEKNAILGIWRSLRKYI